MMRAGGLVLLALLSILAVQKAQDGLAWELLWICHVSAAVLGLGMLAQARMLVATGFLCQIAVALPAYTLHLVSGGETSAASFALHLLAPVFGWLAWRRHKLPIAAAWWGVGLYLVLIAACRAWTPEALNVNLAFHPWGPLAGAGVWPLRVLNLGMLVAQLHLFRFAWNRLTPSDG